MMPDIYVPCDAAALSVGADDVAEAIVKEATRRGTSVRVIRNGSRGMFWLEPLVEVATEKGRVAYGPVTVADVEPMFDAWLAGTSHPLLLGPTDEILFLKSQEEIDPKARAAQYKEIQDRYNTAAPIVYLYETPYPVAFRKNAKGFVQIPLGNNLFEKAYVER